LDAETAADMKDRLDVFNLQEHDLAEKEKAMLAEKEAEKEDVKETEDAVEEELTEAVIEAEEPSTDEAASKDDTPTESADTEVIQAEDAMEALTPEKLKDAE